MTVVLPSHGTAPITTTIRVMPWRFAMGIQQAISVASNLGSDHDAASRVVLRERYGHPVASDLVAYRDWCGSRAKSA